MLVVVEKTSQEAVLEGEPLARGGEALIYLLPGSTDLLAKVYHRPTPEHGDKLAFMIGAPPDDPMLPRGHVSIAWPTDRLLSADADRRCVGYVMRRVDKARRIIEYYNPRSRLQLCPQFHYGYLLRTARNLAAAFRAVHERGYVIGDVNESNILTTSQALVTLVDTDSFQVRVREKVHRCLVGKMEYTPPELQGTRFAGVDRTAEHDVFGLAVLIFQLLMQGMHPFAGVFTGEGEPGSIGRRIADGMWPYTRSSAIPYVPNPHAPPFQILPPVVQELMRRCFDAGKVNASLRPDALSWQRALQEGEKELASCPMNSQHVFHAELRVCPWCELAKRQRRDPFPPRMPMPKEIQPDDHSAPPIDEILDVLPVEPLPIPPVPRSRVVEVEPVVLPEVLPVIEVFPPRSNSLNDATDVPDSGPVATKIRTRLNTEKIDAAILPAPLRGNFLTWTISIGVGVLILVIVLFFVLKKKIVGTGEESGVFKGHLEGVTCVAIAPDGRDALSASNDGTIRYWNVTREELIAVLPGHRGGVRSVVFEPHGERRALSGGADRKLRLWDLDQIKELQVFDGHDEVVQSVAYHPDGTVALSCSSDETLALWDVRTGRLRWRSPRQGTSLTSVAITPDGTRVACGCRTSQIMVWDLDRDKTRLLKVGECVGHSQAVTAVAYSPDGRFIFSASQDSTARMWDAKSFAEIRRFNGHDDTVEGLAVSQDGKRLLTASHDRTVRLWTIASSSQEASFKHKDWVLSVAFAPDGALALSGGEDKVLRKWSLPNK